MSIIETAYGETVAARLCAAIEALEVATLSYQTTGDALVTATDAEYDTRAIHEYCEADCRAMQNKKGLPGKNESERKANLDLTMLDDETVRRAREEWLRDRARLYFAERQHKNAYHQMESLRVAIGGYAAVLGATRHAE